MNQQNSIYCSFSTFESKSSELQEKLTLKFPRPNIQGIQAKDSVLKSKHVRKKYSCVFCLFSLRTK